MARRYRMRLTKRKETTRGLLTLVLLTGSFQLIYLYSNLDAPSTSDFNLRDVKSDKSFRKPTRMNDQLNRSKINDTHHIHYNEEINGTHFLHHHKKDSFYTRQVVRRSVWPIQRPASSLNRGITSEHETTNETASSVTMAASIQLVTVKKRLPPLIYSKKQFIPPVHDPLIYGYRRPSKGFLTIGIPSIRRPNAETIYLYQTLESLINNTSVNDRREITVVVLLCDQNDTYDNEIARDVYSKFQIFSDEGFLRVIKAPKLIYPNLDTLKRTLNDNIERVQWRAKQNVDFAYLCLYSRDISDYYIQLEDDILSAGNFLTYIRNKIKTMTESWFMLEFSRLGFIGKLFKDKDIQWVADFLLLHFDKKPGDLLLGRMLLIKGQRVPMHADYSLFQHNGKFSSLENKMMPSIDSKFKDADNIDLPIMSLPKGNNPPAKFSTTLQAVTGYLPSFAYDGNSSTFYWAETPRRYDHFSLQFENPHSFERIIISTGDPKRKRDSLRNSGLSFATLSSTPRGKCVKYTFLTDFVDGEIDTKAMGITIPRDIVCLRINVKRSSKTWVIIRDIVLI